MFTHSLKCPYCGESYKYDLSDYIIEQNSSEREMGPEIEYTIQCDEIECKNEECKNKECRRTFSVSGSIWEYPEGAYNSKELKVLPIGDEDNEDDDE